MPSKKEIALIFIMIVAQIGAMWSWNDTIPTFIEGEYKSAQQLLVPAVLLVIAGISYAIAALFIERRGLLYLSVYAAMGAPYLLIPATTPVLVALAASMLLGNFATNEIRREKFLSLGFSAYKFLKSGLPIYYTIASITVSFFFISHINEGNAINTLLPSPAIEFLLDKASGPLEPYTGIPRIDPKMTVDDLLRAVTVKQLKERNIGPADISEPEMERLILEQRRAIEEQYSVVLDGRATIPETLQQNINLSTNKFLSPLRAYFPIASAVVFFFTFKALTLPIYYFTIFLVYGIIRLLIKAGIVTKQEVTITVERLMINKPITTPNGKGLLSNPRSGA